MIECDTCHTCIDVDDDVAYELGWSPTTSYMGIEVIGVIWDCPHCVHAEIN